ncbi:MAG: RpiB/LacA/LacB family sugar-phosphate isomerase [Planctomycetaceae bacterium]|jgi:ribose 5-phosphate isomerase B|nr:RpiB/LacA/LacB family sugar-phosphate isomerase [Planctomycetaceae bacterium]
MNVLLGSDHRGDEIRQRVADYLRTHSGYRFETVNDVFPELEDYTEVAAKVAQAVCCGTWERGILVCGTGVGMCVVANKFPGVRAAPCHNETAAELSRQHNDSNILCLSGDLLGERSTLMVVEKWLTTSFSGGRHAARLEKIKHIECNYHPTEYGNELRNLLAIG